MAQARSNRTLLFVLAAVVLAALVLLVARNRRNHPLAKEVSVTNAPPKVSGSRGPTQSVEPAGDTRTFLDTLGQRLRQTNSKMEHRRSLDELRKRLASMPAAQASKLAQEFLASGKDRPTGLDFKVGSRGFLDEAPTLRLFFLDYLSQVDPVAAERFAKEILAAMRSSDEWAVALRVIAATGDSPDSRHLLEASMRQLLHNDSWQRDPTVGYLEAFDVAVHLGGDSLLPDLASLLRLTNNQAVAHAAFLATDRLALRDPVPVLTALQQDLTLLSGREETRANLFARADVSDPNQRAVIEKYLLDTRLTGAELTAFADVFPNENYMISNNLLTTNAPRRGTDIQARDWKTLQVVEAWRDDPRFSRLVPQLDAIQSRLKSFLPQTGK